MSVVSIVRDIDVVRRTVTAINLVGGMEKFVGKGDRVAIKPNLVGGVPHETGETVHPEIIRTLIRLSYAAGAAKVKVGDTVTPKENLSLHSLCEKIAEDENAEMIDLGESLHIEVKLPHPFYFSEVRIAEPLLECDVLINVPALKTHNRAGITVALKNLFGALSRKDMSQYHHLDRIEEVVVDLNIAKRSDLIVVDGTYSTLHNPPGWHMQSKTNKLDLGLAGNDPVAVDAIAARIMGIDPRTLRYLRWAEECNLGTSRLSKIQIRGLTLEEAYRSKTVTTIDYVNKYHDKIELINGGACTGCTGRVPWELVRYTRSNSLDTSSLKEKLHILMGPTATPPPKGKNMILCGDCLAPTFYNRLKGEFVPGCPPEPQDLRGALTKFNLFREEAR